MFRGSKMALFLILVGCICLVSVSSLAASNKPFAGTKLTMIAYASPAVDATKALLPEFEKETGIKVTISDVPYEQLHEKQILELTAGTGTYDVLMNDYLFVGEYAAGKFILPLTKYMKDKRLNPSGFDPKDFIPKTLDAFGTWNGTVYALPYLTVVQLLFYRADLFDKEHVKVPVTWDEYIAACKHFTRDSNGDGKIDFWGHGSASRRGMDVFNEFGIWLWTFGGDILDKNMKPIFNSQSGVDSLKAYRELVEEYATPAATSNAGYEATMEFMQGQTAMLLFWTEVCAMVEDPGQSTVAGKVGYSAPPKKVESVPNFGGYGLCIAKNSKHPEAAYAFISWITSKKIQKKYTLLGGTPTRQSLLDDPELNQKFPYFAAAKKGLVTGKYFPRIPEYPELEEAISLEVHKAIMGQKDPKAALDDAAKRVYGILEKGGYYKKK